MNHTHPYTTFIFDMDGLMVNTEPISYGVWQRLLADYDCTLSEEVHSHMIGRRLVESAQMVLDTYPLPLTLAQLMAERNARYDQALAQGVPEMPGLRELLAALAQRHIPWGVATSSPRAHALAVLAQLQLTAVCQAIAAGDEVAQGKPAPDLYLLAAQRLGTPPTRCIALEDSAPGCRAAAAAGLYSIAIPHSQTAGASFTCARAVLPSLHHVADNLDALLAGTFSRYR